MCERFPREKFLAKTTPPNIPEVHENTKIMRKAAAFATEMLFYQAVLAVCQT